MATKLNISDAELEDKFWSNVTTGATCLEWNGAVVRNGRGWVSAKDVLPGQKAHGIQAHRLAFMIALDRVIPSTDWVLNTCNNPVCVTWDHMYIATPEQKSEYLKKRIAEGTK